MQLILLLLSWLSLKVTGLLQKRLFPISFKFARFTLSEWRQSGQRQSNWWEAYSTNLPHYLWAAWCQSCCSLCQMELTVADCLLCVSLNKEHYWRARSGEITWGLLVDLEIANCHWKIPQQLRINCKFREEVENGVNRLKWDDRGECVSSCRSCCYCESSHCRHRAYRSSPLGGRSRSRSPYSRRPR